MGDRDLYRTGDLDLRRKGDRDLCRIGDRDLRRLWRTGEGDLRRGRDVDLRLVRNDLRLEGGVTDRLGGERFNLSEDIERFLV